MARWRGVIYAAAAMGITALCQAAGVSAAGRAARLAPAPAPPSLVALEQKMSALHVKSLRFSVRTSISLPKRDHQLRQLFAVLGLGAQTSGEATTTPAAANVSLDLLGHKLVMRHAGGKTYLYIHKLARYDKGRPWVKLGPGGLAELVTVNGHHPRPRPQTIEPQFGEPKLAQPPFASLAKLLSGAPEVRELGPGTVDGIPVTRFMAALEPAQLKEQALASVARLVTIRPASDTLEVSLAASGLPVRTVITERRPGVKTSIRIDIPAINFPLVIRAPMPTQTVSVAQLRILEKRARAKHEQRHTRAAHR